MNANNLSRAFFNALSWNALSYIAYRACSTALSFVLFSRLTKQDFIIWSALMSSVFLTLLWIDCGFRKSLPRYCPEFAPSPYEHRRFVKMICLTQFGLILITIPLFCWFLPDLFTTLNAPLPYHITFLGGALLCSEGLAGIMRLIYHAHFWNKQFNSMAIIILLLEVLIALVTVGSNYTSLHLLIAILSLRCLGSLCLVGVSIWRLPTMETNEPHHPINTNKLRKDFAIHSLAMWLANSIKSLSERNFLLPFITYSLGGVAGASFKLANDAALFFYRSALKTIGTSDTTLLTYAHFQKESLGPLFKKLVWTVSLICIPLLMGVLLCALISLWSPNFIPESLVLLFLILAISYLTEVILSPYERLLEVNRNYQALAWAYIPYIVLLALLFYHKAIAHIGMVPFILVIQALRLLSAFIMFKKAQQ